MDSRIFREKFLWQDAKQKEPTFAEEISYMLMEARVMKGLTQVELAKKVKTKQPSIARVENGSALPSLTFLQRIARALKTKLIVKFEFMITKESVNTNSKGSKEFSDLSFQAIDLIKIPERVSEIRAHSSTKTLKFKGHD